MRLTDKQLDEFIAISKKSGIKYKNRAEAYESALSLLRLTKIITKVDAGKPIQKAKTKKRPAD